MDETKNLTDSITPPTPEAQTEATQGVFGKMFSGIGGLGKSLQGIGGLASIGTGIYGMFLQNKALKLQKQALGQAQKQQAIENERWEKRENERLNANAQLNQSAAAWNNPMERD